MQGGVNFPGCSVILQFWSIVPATLGWDLCVDKRRQTVNISIEEIFIIVKKKNIYICII